MKDRSVRIIATKACTRLSFGSKRSVVDHSLAWSLKMTYSETAAEKIDEI